CADVDDGGVLFVAWIAGAGGGLAIFVGERSPGARGEENCAGGDVMAPKEVEEAVEARHVSEKNGGVAAFFDLDGTLMPMPSLEKRFFLMLRYRRLIGIRNYFLWLAEAARLMPRGVNQIMHANKMYLRGVSVDEKDSARVPSFHPEAIERVAWHAERGHLIVIVSGTLEVLAERAARSLEVGLGARGWTGMIRVCATRLEENDFRWTGRIVGEAMIGEAKARAIKRIAADADLDLRRCFAYGDSSSDRRMIEAVGGPTAVNPSNDLGRIARRNDWPVLRWGEERNFTRRARRTQRLQRADETDNELQVARAKAGFGA
ncbi:MAG: HAD-IB family hydrolase, partial [Candidatus Acidiferrum sp.]